MQHWYADAVAALEEDEWTYTLRDREVSRITPASFVEFSDELRLAHTRGNRIGGLDDWKRGFLQGESLRDGV